MHNRPIGLCLLQADIGGGIHAAFEAFEPDAVVHLAAESYVDRSIESSGAFIQTNIVRRRRRTALILGDNIFYGHRLAAPCLQAAVGNGRAIVPVP